MRITSEPCTRIRKSKVCPARNYLALLFFELSLSRHRSLNNSYGLRPHLEFSGLHYCLFVKEHLLCCLLLSHATAYLDYHIAVRLSTTFLIFSNLFRCLVCSSTTKLSISPISTLVNTKFNIFCNFFEQFIKRARNAIFISIPDSFSRFTVLYILLYIDSFQLNCICFCVIFQF